MAWHARFPPLGLGVAGAALAGASVVQVFPALPGLAWTLMVLLAGACLLRSEDLRRPVGALLVGIAWTCLAAQWRLHERMPADAAPCDVVAVGHVVGLPERGEDSLRFDFRIESLRGDAPSLQGGLTRLSWYGRAPRDLEPGSRWRLALRLRPVRGLLNPGGRDAERSALAQGLVATGHVRGPRGAQALAPGGGIDLLRARLSRHIGQVLPDDRGRFVRALAVGDTRGLSDADWEVLRATGLTHQIAISGFHVGLAAGLGACCMRLCWWLLPGLGRRLPRPQAAALGAFLLAVGYTALAGFALPTVRTLLMISILLAARLSRRVSAGRAGFALALLAVLAADPLAVLSAGFWLSFAGVGWLMWCLPNGVEMGLAGSSRGFVRAQAIAVLGLLPLTVWFFGQASLPGPLANLFGVPVISLVVVPLALAGIVLWPVAPGLAGMAWHASATVMDLAWRVLEAIAAWPSALAWLPEPGLLALALALVGAAWCLLPAAVPDRVLGLALFLPLLWPALDRPAVGEVDVQVLDVGQGLSVLVSTQTHRLVYDVGAGGARGPDRGETVVAPALRALGVRRLDLVVISHDSRDHAGGLGAVLQAWPATRVIGPEGWARPGMGLCEAGAHWRWDGVDFRILHPPPDFPHLGREGSCVLRVAAGDHAALLPGDIGEVVQRRLVAVQAGALKAELVIVPRHGALDGSDPAFIAATAPRWAVLSTGAGNRAKLPKPAIVDAWRAAGAQALDSARTGSLCFRLTAHGAWRTELRRADRPRYWREPPRPGSGYATGQATTDR
jgi:competence protein ComEC